MCTYVYMLLPQSGYSVFTVYLSIKECMCINMSKGISFCGGGCVKTMREREREREEGW